MQLSEVGRPKSGPQTIRLNGMLERLFEARAMLLDVCEKIPEFLQQAGFEDVQTETRNIALGAQHGRTGVIASTNFMGVYRGMKTVVLRSGGFGVATSESEYDGFMDSLQKEWDETEGSGIIYHVFYARKPL